LLAKIANVQKHQSDEKQLIKGLNPLQNEVEAQSGKHITHEFAEYLLENITFLKGTK
jgi:hypothetical protein